MIVALPAIVILRSLVKNLRYAIKSYQTSRNALVLLEPSEEVGLERCSVAMQHQGVSRPGEDEGGDRKGSTGRGRPVPSGTREARPRPAGRRPPAPARSGPARTAAPRRERRSVETCSSSAARPTSSHDRSMIPPAEPPRL